MTATVSDPSAEGSAAALSVVAAARRKAQVLKAVTTLGWSVIAIGILAWVVGRQLGWKEFDILAATCLLLAALAACTTLGRMGLKTEVVLNPPRTTVGSPAAARLVVTNPSRRRTLPLRVELPVGATVATFDVPSMGNAAEHEELFILPTSRRGVIPIGPAASVRGDPLGLLRRRQMWDERTELIVHPRTVALEPLGSGLLHDLEGLTTSKVSQSDLSFHSLREYVAGDEMRHVHWRSSARAGRLLVRQFLETRRSAISIVVDGDPGSYADADEFELAMEIAASIAQRATRDGLSAVLAAGGHAGAGLAPHVLLDAAARAELGAGTLDLAALVTGVLARNDDTSLAVIVSGSPAPAERLQQAARRCPTDTQVVLIRVQPGDPPAMSNAGTGRLMVLGSLGDLRAAFAFGIAS
ncbi:DUF58 domain-containing protein [Acidiferrimicrobium sp. IK]|uniref:DUF58 domain-containing protein n=1 Tax=Acidiferrimicrobium sp. IK TaxID=2871700 RepID=UPI0021CB270D|nr:DUF58 domain-containing protein [Acidiferrimicrobium sp. IK]MCU4185604.1 DUF58 domain-containing protein [Acidiferrimicrobium sp. IK]